MLALSVVHGLLIVFFALLPHKRLASTQPWRGKLHGDKLFYLLRLLDFRGRELGVVLYSDQRTASGKVRIGKCVGNKFVKQMWTGVAYCESVRGQMLSL